MNEDICSSKSEVDMVCNAESDVDPFIDNNATMTTGAVARILKESESMKSTQLQVAKFSVKHWHRLLKMSRNHQEVYLVRIAAVQNLQLRRLLVQLQKILAGQMTCCIFLFLARLENPYIHGTEMKVIYPP